MPFLLHATSTTFTWLSFMVKSPNYKAPYAITSILSDVITVLNILSWNTFNLCSALGVIYQGTYPYNTRSKISHLYINPFVHRNFLGQTAASRCESFLMFQELTPSPSSGWWLGVGHLVISFGSTKPQATPWRRGWSQSLNRWENFVSWRGCLTKKFSLNSVAAKASRLKSFCSYPVGIKTKK